MRICIGSTKLPRSICDSYWITCPRRGYSRSQFQARLYLFTWPAKLPELGNAHGAVRSGQLDDGRCACRQSGIPLRLRERILYKAEGNPFFVEEVVKSLQESGALQRAGGQNELMQPLEEIVVPDTIQDAIMARIDRLGEEPKRMLQQASAIGWPISSNAPTRCCAS